MGQLDGKVALVMGGTSGLGATAARAMAAQGAAVVIAGRRLAQGKAVVAQIKSLGGKAHFVRTDLTIEGEVKRAVAETVRHFDRLDIAFNNAGANYSAGPLETISAETFALDIATNLTSAFFSMKHEIPAMRQTGRGSIINTASSAGVMGVERIAGYVAAKHGLIGLTRTAALELATQNIRVNAIVLGPMASESWQSRADATPGAMALVKNGVPMGRPASMDEACSLVVYLASDAASFITGAALAVDGGVTAR